MRSKSDQHWPRQAGSLLRTSHFDKFFITVIKEGQCCLVFLVNAFLLLTAPVTPPISLLSFRFRLIPLGSTSDDLWAIRVAPLRPLIPRPLGTEKKFLWGEAQSTDLVLHTRYHTATAHTNRLGVRRSSATARTNRKAAGGHPYQGHQRP